MIIFSYTDYRIFLRDHLAEATRRNPAFSLRALARQFGMSPALLSAVLRGKKNLSQERAMRIAARLGLSESEADFLLLLVRCETVKDPKVAAECRDRVIAETEKSPPEELSDEAFKAISSWHHVAILELTCVDGFILTAANVASRLRIPEAMALDALERLKALTLLKCYEDGIWRKTNKNLMIKSASHSEALRAYHRETLSKATESLITQTPTEKFIGSETFAFDAESLGEFTQLTERYFSQVVRLAARSLNKRQVYHLGIQFFRLTECITSVSGEKP